mmetsp:Transcript_7050/g.14155  ORF Transcript_7050/g.14155 Transcript_7050/m.14155 type:complete len:206 (-) Transcript_7050:191-808(-)
MSGGEAGSHRTWSASWAVLSRGSGRGLLFDVGVDGGGWFPRQSRMPLSLSLPRSLSLSHGRSLTLCTCHRDWTRPRHARSAASSPPSGGIGPTGSSSRPSASRCTSASTSPTGVRTPSDLNLGHALPPRLAKYRRPRSIRWQFDLVPLGQKGIEPQNQSLIPVKQCRHPLNHPGSIDLLGFEGLHDVEEFVVDVGTVAEFEFDLV